MSQCSLCLSVLCVEIGFKLSTWIFNKESSAAEERIWLMIILCMIALLFVTTSPAQSCNPAVVDYLIRDEKGQILSEADVKSIAAQLPKQVGNANVGDSQVSFAEDKKTYYWPESVDWEKGTRLPALSFANASTCTLHLEEVTLTYKSKKMRLIFNIDIARGQNDRRPVVDSLRFQEGTFKLDLSGWTKDEDKIIPASRWKKIN